VITFKEYLEEAGKVHRVGGPAEKRGAPQGMEKARMFDTPQERKNRSVLYKMHGDRNEFFATGDHEVTEQDDEIAFSRTQFAILVMSGGDYSDKYYGVNVIFTRDGKIDGATFDERADKEWENPKKRAKIIAAAKEWGDKHGLQKWLNPVGSMVDDDDDASPEAKELAAKLAARRNKSKEKK